MIARINREAIHQISDTTAQIGVSFPEHPEIGIVTVTVALPITKAKAKAAVQVKVQEVEAQIAAVREQNDKDNALRTTLGLGGDVMELTID